MEKGTLKQWGALLGTTGILLIAYYLTLPPSLTWAHHGADGGELATAVVKGSIPHPPGFPTYLVLGELFIRLPWGDPARRLSLMSAVFAAGAAGLTTMTVWSLFQREKATAPPLMLGATASAAGLSLGLAPLFWSQAIIVEVYAPAAFFAALVIALSVRKGPLWALVSGWGIGLGVHPTLLFLAPLVIWSIWKRKQPLWLATACSLILLGWGILLYGLVILARGITPFPWGDVSTLDGWWAFVSAQLYRGYLFGLRPDAYPQRLLAWAGLLTRQFTPVGMILTGLGIAWLWQRWRPLVLATALAFMILSIYAIGYNTSDSLVYLAPALPLVTLWLGVGLFQAVNWLRNQVSHSPWLRKRVYVILLLPLVQALLFWGEMDLSDNRTATDWAEQVLHQAPPQAILITDRDWHTFTLWYAHDALGKRPDVVIIDADFWGYPPYHKMMVNSLELDRDEPSLEKATQLTKRPTIRVVDLITTEEKTP